LTIWRNVGLEIVYFENYKLRLTCLSTIHKPSFKTIPVWKDSVTSRIQEVESRQRL